MKPTNMYDCQLETEAIKVRFHRIFLALVFTGILYFHVEPSQQQVTETGMAFGASQIFKPVMVHESQVK